MRQDDYVIPNLVGLGFVSATEADGFRKEADEASNLGAVDLMLKHGIIWPPDVAEAKAHQFCCQTVRLRGIGIPDEVIAIVTSEIARQYQVVPVRLAGRDLVIATAKPENLDAIDSVSHLVKKDLVTEVTYEADIAWALDKYYSLSLPQKPKEDFGIGS